MGVAMTGARHFRSAQMPGKAPVGRSTLPYDAYLWESTVAGLVGVHCCW